MGISEAQISQYLSELQTELGGQAVSAKRRVSVKNGRDGIFEDVHDAIQEERPEVKIAAVYRLDELEEMQKTISEEQNAGKDPEDQENQENSDPEVPENAETASDNEGTTDSEDLEEEAADMTQEDVVRYLLEKNPNIKGIYTTNEEAAKLAVSVLEELENKDIKIVSFDGGEDQLELLENGKVEGLIVQNPYGMGYATVVACARAVLDQANEAEVNTGYVWVTKDNLQQETISRMMY